MIIFETNKSDMNRKPYSNGTRTWFNRNAEVESFLKDLRIFSSEKSKKIKKPIVEFAQKAAEFVMKQVKVAAKQAKVAIKHFKF